MWHFLAGPALLPAAWVVPKHVLQQHLGRLDSPSTRVPWGRPRVELVLIDQTQGRQIVDSCGKPESSEFQLLHDLAEELNVFTIVGPRDKDGNVLFLADGAAECKQVA